MRRLADMTPKKYQTNAARVCSSVRLTLIEVADQCLGDTERATTPEGKIVYSSRARTLVDAVYDWSRFNSLPRAYAWIRKDLAAKRVSPVELVASTINMAIRGRSGESARCWSSWARKRNL